MNTYKITSIRKQQGRIHPLVATAAVAVTLVSLVGVAAITGVLPTSHGTTAAVAANTYATPITAPNGLMDNGSVGTNAPVVSQSPNYVPVPAYAPAPAPAPIKHAAPVKHAAPRQAAANNNYQSNSQGYADQSYQVAQAPAICHSCGRVESVVAVHGATQPTSGLGIAGGAVVGGLLGNQVGNGNGRTLATIAGAVAGGYGGNEVEKRTHTTTTYQVRVRMDDGSTRTFPQSTQDGWRTGDQVRVVNGALTSRS